MYTPPGLKFFLNINTIDSLALTFSPIYSPLPHSWPTYISSLPKTVKRKPLISNFNWNFGWILGQHDILVLGDVPLPPPPPNQNNFFYQKLDFSWLMYTPPPQGLEKNLQNMKCWFFDYVQLLMIG